jgi:CheY-like chemotaxis protein
MLIEDDFILRAHLAELLMMQGYEVYCAADGAEALRRLAREPAPSVILVDMIMPRVDGVTFRERQLRTPGLSDIPTIAVTSLKSTSHLGGLRFAAIVRKPVDLDRMLSLLEQVCPTS